jgi:hypothetical protein
MMAELFGLGEGSVRIRTCSSFRTKLGPALCTNDERIDVT